MPIAVDESQRQLAESAAGFAARHGDAGRARHADEIPAWNRRPEWWTHLVDTGFHAIHLPESAGGQGGTVMDLAVVVGEFGRALLPGPFVPTVCASATVAAGQGAAADRLTERFAAGATGAVIGPEGITATDRDGGWVLTGSSGPAPGAVAADHLVVGATDERGQRRWFALAPDASGVAVRPEQGIDLTRDIGTVSLDAVSLSADDEIGGLDTDAVTAIGTALLACEAAGIFRWSVDAVTDYVKIREQFGKPVGSFQAVQHRVARMLVACELATAAAWDGVRGLDGAAVQRRLAVSAAAVVSLGRVVDAAVEALAVFGGIGFTWEHDLHLYWRRAMSIASLTGPTSQWIETLGEANMLAARDFSIRIGDEEAEFRSRVGELLDRALELPDGEPGLLRFSAGPRRDFLAEAGLVAPHLPAPYGLDATPRQQLVVDEEFARRALPRPHMAIGDWVVPTLIILGTDEQRGRLAGPSLRGEVAWCQLYSEPGAGSDVAAVSTRAVEVDGGWRVTGQKIWTSLAQHADFGAALVRTDPDQPKHRGLSCLIIDMHASGVTVRPLKQATGASHFNEVFFDDVFVPDANVVGEPGKGWNVALATLANERRAIAGSETGNEARIRDIITAGRFAGTRADAIQALGRVAAEGAAIAALNLRSTLRLLEGGAPGTETSVAKVAAAQLRRTAAIEAFGLSGPLGAVADPKEADAATAVLDIGTWILGGGTAEIQLNIISQFVLGLPRP